MMSRSPPAATPGLARRSQQGLHLAQSQFAPFAPAGQPREGASGSCERANTSEALSMLGRGAIFGGAARKLPACCLHPGDMAAVGGTAPAPGAEDIAGVRALAAGIADGIVPPALPECDGTAKAGVRAIFDFDWSMVNENTDTFCFQQLLDAGAYSEAVARCRSLSSEVGWTAAIDWAHAWLADSLGKSAADVLRALSSTPMDASVVRSLEALCSRGVEISIVSDSNSLFIAQVLGAHGVRVPEPMARALAAAMKGEPESAAKDPAVGCAVVTRVATNVAWVDSGSGAAAPGVQRIRLRPHDPRPVGCPRCPSNLCKGRALHAILRTEVGVGKHAAVSPAPCRVVYVGDGSNDMCPSMCLRECDVVLARKGFRLAKELTAKPDSVRCTVRLWEDGSELAALLLESAVSPPA